MSDQRQSIPPAHPPSARMLRRTFAWRFQPEHVKPLEDFGELLLGACQEAGSWGDTGGLGVVHGSLTAAADDLESLADYFAELADTPVHAQVTHEELAACRKAAAWADILREVVEDVRSMPREDAS